MGQQRAAEVRTLRPEVKEINTIEKVLAQTQLIREIKTKYMIDKEHYGSFGRDKPTLLLPGADFLMSIFGLTSEVEIVDKTDTDEEFCVIVKVIFYKDGECLGWTLGECSTKEEKYGYRKAICKEEFEATPKKDRRIKFKQEWKGGIIQIQQVRTNPKDNAPTIVQMAYKRGKVAGVREALNATSLFSVNTEDLPEDQRGNQQDQRGNQQTNQKQTPPKSQNQDQKKNRAVTPKTLIDKWLALHLDTSLTEWFKKGAYVKYEVNSLTDLTPAALAELAEVIERISKDSNYKATFIKNLHLFKAEEEKKGKPETKAEGEKEAPPKQPKEGTKADPKEGTKADTPTDTKTDTKTDQKQGKQEKQKGTKQKAKETIEDPNKESKAEIIKEIKGMLLEFEDGDMEAAKEASDTFFKQQSPESISYSDILNIRDEVEQVIEAGKTTEDEG